MKFTNMVVSANPELIDVEFFDNHNGGETRTMPTGLWIKDNGDKLTFAMDMGERVHCLNTFSYCKRNDRLELSPWSISGTYMVTGEEDFLASLTHKDILGRLRFDSQDELEAFLKTHANEPFKNLEEVLDLPILDK